VPANASLDKEIAMNAAPAAQPVSDFVQNTTMKSILGIEDDALDQVMATAYALYQAGRYPEVDVLCRGLIAADHTYWWSYSLHAATLRRLGRLQEALAATDAGLCYEPRESKLLVMRHELVAALAALPDTTAGAPAALRYPTLMPAVPATAAR
jgi:hypothetical protein